MEIRMFPARLAGPRRCSNAMNHPYWIPLIVAALALVPFSLCLSTGDKIGCGCMAMIISLMLVTAIRLR